MARVDDQKNGIILQFYLLSVAAVFCQAIVYALYFVSKVVSYPCSLGNSFSKADKSETNEEVSDELHMQYFVVDAKDN
jgi:hypothetical protein